MEDLADRSATELARLVRSREVSPVEVIEACLARVERYHHAVNAVVTLNPRALDDAGDLELRLVRGEEVGLLAGLPVGIKIGRASCRERGWMRVGGGRVEKRGMRRGGGSA